MVDRILCISYHGKVDFATLLISNLQLLPRLQRLIDQEFLNLQMPKRMQHGHYIE